MFCQTNKINDSFHEMKNNVLVEFLTKKMNTSFCAKNFDNITHPRSVLDLCGAKLRFYDVQHTAFVCVTFHNGVDIDVHSRLITSIHIVLVLSSLDPTSLSSHLFYLTSHCGLVCLRYVSVALVANLAMISSLSSSLSISTFSSLSVLDYSFAPSWLSSSAYVLGTICSSFNQSNASGFVNLHKLHWVLLLESSYFLGCFASTTIFLFPLAFKIYGDLYPISLVLMIMLIIMGLCCFPIWSLLPVMNWDSSQDSSQVTSCTILISL